LHICNLALSNSNQIRIAIWGDCQGECKPVGNHPVELQAHFCWCARFQDWFPPQKNATPFANSTYP
jgi:hypothetical protein